MLNQQAPHFSLESTIGQQIHLKDLLGGFVVLVFYPWNECPRCIKTLGNMSLNVQALFDHNVRVFGVNTGSAEKSAEFCMRRKLEFPILSDPGGVTAKKYGAFMKWLPFNKRVSVVIDPMGKICYYKHGTPAAEEILDHIKQGLAA